MDANLEAKSPAEAAVKVVRLLEQNGLTMLLNIIFKILTYPVGNFIVFII